MKKTTQLTIAVLIILFIGINLRLFSMEPIYQNLIIQTKNKTINIKAEIARTKKEKARGLMYRKQLADGRGMLFIYEKPVIPYFWMKNMEMSIDMIFIDESLTIKKIIHQAPPCIVGKECPSYTYSGKIKYVLELPSNYSKNNNIFEGDQIILKNKSIESLIGPERI